MTLLGEEERDRPPVAAFAPLDQPIRNQPVEQADRTGVRQAKDATKLIVRRPQSISDDDQRSGRFPGAVRDIERNRLNAVRNGEAHSAEQICCPVTHDHYLRAQRTFFN